MITSAELEAASKLAWPLLAGFLVWKLYPGLRQIIESRSFTVKVGDMEISVQEASKQLREQITDLQQQIAKLQSQPLKSAQTFQAEVGSSEPKRILWVDDNPSNNAMTVANLRDAGMTVIQAVSTFEAMKLLFSGSQKVDFIISDMGRKENGNFVPDAGLALIDTVRKANINVPIFIVTRRQNMERYSSQLIEKGVKATSSPYELLQLIKSTNA